MVLRLHVFPSLLLLLVAFALQLQISWWIWNSPKWKTPSRRALLAGATLFVGSLETLSYLLGFYRVARHFPILWSTWIEAAGLVMNVGLIGLWLGGWLWKSAPKQNTARRTFLQAAGATVMAAPFVITAMGVAERRRFRLNEVEVKLPGLAPDLNGLRITQISDIHLSAFLNERELAHAIDMANETKPHIMLLTGDLITRQGDPLDACLRQLARLRADAGILGCHGNHEDYCQIKDYVTEEGRKIGIDFLRGRSRVLRFGKANLNIAGVDYQQFRKPYLRGAEELVVPGMTNILLSHNPDVFPVSAAQGFDLTVSGHTHGGQVNFEILRQDLNVARYFTPYVMGLYRIGKTSAYVSSGLGTIGVPVRIGAPAEVAVLKLCAT